MTRPTTCEATRLVIIKVGIEGETESAMFVLLTLAAVGLLSLPATRTFFTARAAA